MDYYRQQLQTKGGVEMTTKCNDHFWIETLSQGPHCGKCGVSLRDHLDVSAIAAQKQDMVNAPPHYNQGGIECIDAIAAATSGKTGIEAVCVANVIKYLWRYELKNGAEDVAKAAWYLDRLQKELSK